MSWTHWWQTWRIRWHLRLDPRHLEAERDQKFARVLLESMRAEFEGLLKPEVVVTRRKTKRRS